jgi:hypothetical protein
MVENVLTIVNKARNRLGLTNMTASEFDSGTQREHLVLRAEFQNVYNKLVRLKGEEFRKTFTLSTSDGVNGYSLGFDSQDLSTVQLYVQSAPNNIQPYQLIYITEDEARRQYPNLADIPEGIPSTFFIATTNTEATKLVYFINKPDGIYSILGYQMVDPSSLSSSNDTACTALGDEYLESSLASVLAVSQGFMDQATLFTKEAEEALNCYLGEEFRVDFNINFPLPRMHGRGGRLANY